MKMENNTFTSCFSLMLSNSTLSCVTRMQHHRHCEFRSCKCKTLLALRRMFIIRIL